MKRKGILIYLISMVFLGLLTVFSLPFAMEKSPVYLLISFFVFITFLGMGKALEQYNNIFQFSDVGILILKEREEFSRVLHSEIIQDIYCLNNFLSMKEPDLEMIKEMSTDLEFKTRKLMYFYQNNILEDIKFEENLEDIFNQIENLYGDYLKKEILLPIEKLEKITKEERRLILTITKELINNIYKHSKGDFFRYELIFEEKQMIIKTENNGVTKKDFDKIENSKKGLYLLEVLVETDGGEFNYSLEDDILMTKVSVKGDYREITTTR